MKALTLTLSLILLACGTASAQPGIIPTALKTFVNQMSFIADLASRCDTRLSVRGKVALESPECRDFRAKMRPFFHTMKAHEDQIRQAATAADHATSYTMKAEWTMFFRDFETAWDTINRTIEHDAFYRN